MVTVTDLSTTASLIGEVFILHIFRASLDATSTHPPSKEVSFTSLQNCANSKLGCSHSRIHASGSGKVCEDGSGMFIHAQNGCLPSKLSLVKLLLPFVLFELCTDVEGLYKHYYMQYQYVTQYWYIDVENVECAEEVVVCVEGVVLHVDDVAVCMCSMCSMGGSMWGTGGLM